MAEAPIEEQKTEAPDAKKPKAAARKFAHGLVGVAHGEGNATNHGRPTQAWFFRPPAVDPTGRSMTGLPEDCFYTTSAWQGHQVEAQTRKEIVLHDGSVETVKLVMQVDQHGAKKNGGPLIAMRAIDSNADSKRRWQVICNMIEAAREPELEVEERLLAGIEDDLQYAMGDPNTRTALRERQVVLRQRIDHLKAGVDFVALKAFFDAEAEASQRPVRAPGFMPPNMREANEVAA